MISSGGDLKMGIIGALTAGAFKGIGDHFAKFQGAIGTTTNYVTNTASIARNTLTAGQQLLKTAAHGLVGGLSSVASENKRGRFPF